MDNLEPKFPYYTVAEPHPKGLIHWCKSHTRIATHKLHRKGMCAVLCCDPNAGGKACPCHVVEVTLEWYRKHRRPFNPEHPHYDNEPPQLPE